MLEFRVTDGWGPLCAFLGKKVPEAEFPHVNESAWIKESHIHIFWTVVRLALIMVLKGLIVVVSAGWGIWWVGRRVFGSWESTIGQH